MAGRLSSVAVAKDDGPSCWMGFVGPPGGPSRNDLFQAPLPGDYFCAGATVTRMTPRHCWAV